jgi:hypothetical protein
MKIYGKSLSEVFADMPWAFKVVVFCGALFIIFACYHATVAWRSLKAQAGPQSTPMIKLTDNAGGEDGMFDPSAVTDGEDVVMSYTTLAQMRNSSEKATSIRLIKTRAPACDRWQTVRETSGNGGAVEAGFTAMVDEPLGPDSRTPLGTGTWRVETSSLVYDPDDKGNEWKLYAYKYLWLDKSAGLPQAEIAKLYSFITYKHAPDITGPWSPEEWVFAAKPDAPPQPYNTMVQLRLNPLDPSLADVYFYSRPSVIYHKGVLYMTLSAYLRSRMSADRIILLASTDHGKNWQYLGTPLRHDDVAKLGNYTVLNGGGLIKSEDQIYFWIVPGSEKLSAQGAVFMSFDNLAKAVLKADEKGAPEVLTRLKLKALAPGKVGGGFPAYVPSCDTGIFSSEYSEITKGFQIFKTGEKLEAN